LADGAEGDITVPVTRPKGLGPAMIRVARATPADGTERLEPERRTIGVESRELTREESRQACQRPPAKTLLSAVPMQSQSCEGSSANP